MYLILVDGPLRQACLGTHHRGNLFPVEGAPFLNRFYSGGHLIGKKLAILFADFLVFISSLVVTASFSCSLLALLAGMALSTQRWHEALGWQQLHQCALTQPSTVTAAGRASENENIAD